MQWVLNINIMFCKQLCFANNCSSWFIKLLESQSNKSKYDLPQKWWYVMPSLCIKVSMVKPNSISSYTTTQKLVLPICMLIWGTIFKLSLNLGNQGSQEQERFRYITKACKSNKYWSTNASNCGAHGFCLIILKSCKDLPRFLSHESLILENNTSFLISGFLTRASREI